MDNKDKGCIIVHRKTRNRLKLLRKLKKDGNLETYDDLFNRLADNAEKKN